MSTAIQFDFIPLFAFANLVNSHLMVDLSKIALSSDLQRPLKYLYYYWLLSNTRSDVTIEDFHTRSLQPSSSFCCIP